MYRSLLCLFLFSVCCLGFNPINVKADIITAEYVPGSFSSGSSVSGFNNGVTFMPAQVFTATVSGNLSKISVGVWSTSAANLIVELRSVSANLPTSTILASGSINPGIAFADQTLHTVDLSSSGVSLLANTQYAIALHTASASPNVAWSGDFGNGYAGGDLATSNNNGVSWSSAGAGTDGVFQVTVTAVPEPSACLLAGLGLGTVLLRRRRQVSMR